MSCVLYTQIVFYKHHCWAHTVKIILNRIANLYLFEWYVKMQTLLSHKTLKSSTILLAKKTQKTKQNLSVSHKGVTELILCEVCL